MIATRLYSNRFRRTLFICKVPHAGDSLSASHLMVPDVIMELNTLKFHTQNSLVNYLNTRS